MARENALHQQRLERLAALKTKADAEAYVRTVRGKIRESFGPFPEKTPLNARVTKVVERDAYKIENVLFESRPGFLVSANLYVPKGRRFPLPGVVGSCGHSANGKAIDTYQSFCQGLARLGYVVLIFDPIGQGERMQYVDANWKPIRGTGTAEHNYAGIQQVLVDERFCTWRAWDAVRALDYLVTREGGRPAPSRDHRQLGRRHDDHVAVRPGRPVDDGRAELLRHRAAAEHGERAGRRYGADPAARARAWPRSRGLSRGARAEAGHHPGQGEGLLRRARERSRVRAAEAPLPAPRRRGQRRVLHRADLPRLLAGEPRGDVPMVQSLHRHLRRQDRAEAGDGEGRDALVHAARPGRRAAIEADS